MKNIYRIMFWGLVCTLSLAAGIVGVITNNQLFSQRKNELNSIISYYNESDLLKEYRLANVMVSASLDNKDIVVTYEGIESKKYRYVLYNGYLKTTYNKNDSFAKVSLMLITDAISQYYGNPAKNVYSEFNNDEIYNYTFDKGINFELNKNKYIVKINLNKPLDLIVKTNEEIEETNDNITNYAETTSEVTNNENTEIDITEQTN